MAVSCRRAQWEILRRSGFRLTVVDEAVMMGKQPPNFSMTVVGSVPRLPRKKLGPARSTVTEAGDRGIGRPLTGQGWQAAKTHWLPRRPRNLVAPLACSRACQHRRCTQVLGKVSLQLSYQICGGSPLNPKRPLWTFSEARSKGRGEGEARRGCYLRCNGRFNTLYIAMPHRMTHCLAGADRIF